MRLFAEQGAMQIAVSDLAKAAGLSRGTIYNNVDNPEALFHITCGMLYQELRSCMRSGLKPDDDPALNISILIRQLIRRVHDEPDWGRFIALFAITEPQLGAIWAGEPADIIREGVASGRFDVPADQIPSVTTLGGGALMGSASQVLSGAVTWRKSSSEIAELYLRAMGIGRSEAHRLAFVEFDPMPQLDFSAVAQGLTRPEEKAGSH
ncbi:Bacterial regulatory proteins, tetR family [Thalassovita gelatinovora]|uniref:Bacterial regulatory proteins, tetR family n=2 Tax=Thalassovita gelatinovora TaxID=53501 RepID=A0A0P1FID6_THAGE|nr:Bacterial regulatory proteins, tetR family [Thalassovita gelatinovora]SEP71491.1 transcriptional regulator, TetR family [Thalassovita gelatinovora]